MKKMNKKGFTLIELLAVIVILAIIMVIAVPQILNVINNSRTSAWNDNVKMIEKAIETNEALLGTNMGASNGTVSVLSTAGCAKDNVEKIAGLVGTTDTSITGSFSNGTCTLTLTGAGQFANQTQKTLTCTSNGCN